MKQLPTQAASKAHAPCSTIFKKHYRTPCTEPNPSSLPSLLAGLPPTSVGNGKLNSVAQARSF